MSLDRLMEKIAALQTPTVVVLDPDVTKLPEFLRREAVARFDDSPTAAAEAVLTFNKGIIDAVCDIVPAVKPQMAYYELLGWQGMRALAQTARYARSRGMFVILDGKRGDIGTTMTAYAAAHLGGVTGDAPFEGDALTVNAYLGRDGVAPLLPLCRERDAGFFVLVKTSNPSSGELQDLELGRGDTVYEAMGALCEKWGAELPGKYGYSGSGAVVGATYPEQLRSLREKLPHTFFLVPGYGAQGGGADDAALAFDENGGGAVVNSSRAILYAWKGEGADERDFAAAARREALRMRDELMKRIGEIHLAPAE